MPKIGPGFPLAAAVIAASAAFVPAFAEQPPPPTAAPQVPVLSEKLAPPAPTAVPAQTTTTVPAPAKPVVPAPIKTVIAAPTAPSAVPAPAPAVPPPPPAPPPVSVVPLWAAGLLVAIGGLVGGIGGFLALVWSRRSERVTRRRAAATVLVAELTARRRAFDRVPAPPNAEAGISFVSAVSALESLTMGFAAAGGDLALLPPTLSTRAVEHYAEVRRISTFVKGQSLAAAARMLQANRMGGSPSPDAATVRAAYNDLAGAFHDVDALVAALERYR